MKYRNSKESNRNMFTAEEEEQLQKRKDEYMSGWQQCLDSVRASLRDYPNVGGDADIMAEVDRLIKKSQETEKEIEVVPEVKFTFTHATLMTFMEGIMALAVEQAKRKNKDYASTVVQGIGSTGLANFYETSRRCGGTTLHAIAVHRLKHELSIEKMLRGEELESEPIMGRIIDAINYNILALALYIETRQDMELLNKAADKMAALGVTLGTTDYNYTKENK